jgi:nucleoid DNA-binding protein
LTKDDFVTLVADKGAMSKAEAGRAVEAFCSAVTAAMEKGGDIKLPRLRQLRDAGAGRATGAQSPHR